MSNQNFENYVAVLDLWPSREDLCRDTKQKLNTVNQWRYRNSIPPQHWDTVVVSAKARGIPGVTHEALAKIASSKATQ